MHIKYIPQRNDKEIEYLFEKDVITATYNGVSDTFDFSQMPNGKVININTVLEELAPVISVERVDGELYVELLYHYKNGETPPESEVLNFG